MSAQVIELGRYAIVAQQRREDQLRCRCPACLILDARYPDQGFQLALFPYEARARNPITLRKLTR